MARIDDDEDDDFEYEDDGGAQPWKQRLLKIALVCVGVGLGFLIPYMLYLNHQVTLRFDQLRWQLPTRVYARPLQLQPGIALDTATLKTELDAAAYFNDGIGTRPGTYAIKGDHALISSRGFDDMGGHIAPHRIDVTLGDDRVVAVTDRDSHKAVPATRLDPARIATLYGRAQEERRLVSLDEVPEKLVTGLQAVEDKNFAHHHGVDPVGMMRAVWVALRSRGESRQGASTLTQQLARSGLLGIGKEVTPSRKLNEILYAIILEMRYDKRTILETYLNQVYLGQQGSQAIHGIESASEFWFGRDVQSLNNEQIALLIAIVRGPSFYDPRRHPDRALARRGFVLDKMRESNILTQAQYDAAMKAPLGVTPAPGNGPPNRFPAYVDLVRRQLASDYSSDSLQGAGLSVMTAMSPSAQAYAEGSVTATLAKIGSRGRPPLQAGLVVTDVHTGEVVAVVGSRDFREQGFNRALDAQRPIGSLVKPFTYMLALAQPSQWSLATFVEDEPVTVLLGNGKKWSPDNSDGRSHGTVRVIDALAHSYNQATVRIGMQVRAERVSQLLKVLAALTVGTQPSTLLGATDQSPYGMAQAYQFLASDGEIQPLRAVRGVLDPKGKAVNRYDKTPAPAQSGDAVAAHLVTVALQRVVTSGTAHQLMSDGFGRLTPAGKTGTSNDSRDSWFAGWTGDHLAVIWVGNDQNQPTGLYGATGAMRVWSGIFRKLPTSPLTVKNKGLDWQWVSGSNSTDASCPGAQRLPFVQGYAPPYQPCGTTLPNPDEPIDGPPVDPDDPNGGATPPADPGMAQPQSPEAQQRT